MASTFTLFESDHPEEAYPARDMWPSQKASANQQTDKWVRLS